MIAESIIGGGMGLINAAIQNEQNRENAKLSEEAQNRLADNAAERSYQMWLKTGVAGMNRQLEKEGMNKALMYGLNGAGGATTNAGSGGSVNVAPAADPGLQNAMGMALQNANMELIKAQTAKTEAEATKIAGVDTDQAKAQLDLTKIEGQLQGRSLEDKLSIIQDQERILRTQALVGENTAPDQIKKVNQELTNLAIQQIAMEKGIQLDNVKIAEITAGIQQKWEQLNIQKTSSRWEHDDRLKSIEEYTKTALYAAGINAAGSIISDVTKIATKQVPVPNKGNVSTTTNGNGDILREIWTRPL